MIRPATVADLPAIEEIETHSFSAVWTHETFAEELAKPHARVDVLLLDGTIRAYASYWLVVPGAQVAAEVHILSIATHPDYRRRGLGAELLAHALTEGRAIGAELATLEVRRGNVPAIALYEAHGFRTVHTRARYYKDGEDALVMISALPAK